MSSILNNVYSASLKRKKFSNDFLDTGTFNENRRDSKQ